MYTILLVIHTVIVVFLIMMVLIQRTDSDGMGGLGGGGGNQFMTGRAQANLLTRITSFLAGAFMLTSLTLAIMASHMTSSSILDTVPTPAQTEAPATPTAVPAKQDKIINEKAASPKTAAPAVPKPE